MNYRAILSARAEADIRAMPAALAIFTLRQLQNLEASPTALSRRSHFPFRQHVQIFNFDFRDNDKYYIVNVLFQYGDDETTLYIADAPWVEADEMVGMIYKWIVHSRPSHPANSPVRSFHANPILRR